MCVDATCRGHIRGARTAARRHTPRTAHGKPRDPDLEVGRSDKLGASQGAHERSSLSQPAQHGAGFGAARQHDRHTRLYDEDDEAGGARQTNGARAAAPGSVPTSAQARLTSPALAGAGPAAVDPNTPMALHFIQPASQRSPPTAEPADAAAARAASKS
jgi:hypothetical protein